MKGFLFRALIAISSVISTFAPLYGAKPAGSEVLADRIGNPVAAPVREAVRDNQDRRGPSASRT
jgi:hypothetical protein